MAINPPVDYNNEPLRVFGEHFILQRPNIEFEIIIDPMGRLTGVGKALLTSSRLILINRSDQALKAFDIPLALVIEEEFVHPMFNADYI